MRYSCHVLIKLDTFRQIFFKNPEISNFMKIRPAGQHIVPYGQTDREAGGQ